MVLSLVIEKGNAMSTTFIPVRRALRDFLGADATDALCAARSALTGESPAALRTLAGLRRPVKTTPQVVHGDLFGTVLFAGAAAPAITDIVPYYRPAAWASAVVVVDALAWGGADEDLIERWSHLEEWPQMLLRATMFRLGVHALHPRSTAGALPGLMRVVDQVRLLV